MCRGTVIAFHYMREAMLMSDDGKIRMPGITRPIQPLSPPVPVQKKAPAGRDKKKRHEKKKNAPEDGGGSSDDGHIDIMA